MRCVGAVERRCRRDVMQWRQRHSLAGPAASIRIRLQRRRIDRLRSRRIVSAAMRRRRLRRRAHWCELIRIDRRRVLRPGGNMGRREREARRRDRRHRHAVRVVVVWIGWLRAMWTELRMLVGVDRSAARRRVLIRRTARLDVTRTLRIGRLWLIVDARLGPRPTRARPSPSARRPRDRRSIALRGCGRRRRRSSRCFRRPIAPPALALRPIAMLDHIGLERHRPRRALELLTASVSVSDQLDGRTRASKHCREDCHRRIVARAVSSARSSAAASRHG